MRQGFIKYAQKNCVWWSLILHFLLLAYFILAFQFQAEVKQKDLPNLMVPSYIQQQETPAFNPPQQPVKKTQTAKNGLEKAQPQTQSESVPPTPVRVEQQASKASEPINLVGNKNIRKPLLELLGKALAKTLVYPKIALDFNLHGISYVGFILQPTGELDEVHLVKSSGQDILDEAAVVGVKAISPVKNVNVYLTANQPMIVGIIFK